MRAARQAACAVALRGARGPGEHSALLLPGSCTLPQPAGLTRACPRAHPPPRALARLRPGPAWATAFVPEEQHRLWHFQVLCIPKKSNTTRPFRWCLIPCARQLSAKGSRIVLRLVLGRETARVCPRSLLRRQRCVPESASPWGLKVLQRRLRRVAEDVRVSVGEDIDEIAAHGLPETAEDGWVRLAAALPSADILLDELQVRRPAVTSPGCCTPARMCSIRVLDP